MAAKNVDLMSSYEKRLISKLEKTNADYLKENRMLMQETTKAILGVQLDDSKLTIGQKLVVKRLSFLLANPREIDLKKIADVTDDKKIDKIETDISASDVFKGIKAVGVVTTNDSKSKNK